MGAELLALLSRSGVVPILLLAVAVLVTGMAVSYVKFESRLLFNERERLRVQQDELAIDWGRLQIELATWAEPGRVQQQAVDKLKMQAPLATELVVIR